ncbi:MAG: thiamine pyrophosphate-binding protein [Phycisphaeraceae bacterium]
MAKTTTIGKYLIHRLEEMKLGHVFGIPGDYVLGFYDLLVASRMKVIGTCGELGAGFAADAYARVSGLGCLCVTYCVGGFPALNAVAGAYAEKSPLIVISGAPGMSERQRSSLLHHKVRDFHTQLNVFEQVTIAAVALEDPKLAPQKIDECILACLRHKRPVYIELPRDLVGAPCAGPQPLPPIEQSSDPLALREAISEAVAMIKSAKKPAILAGVEIHRFGLQQMLLDLVDQTGLPVAATLLGKSIISEIHPQYLGVYEGAMGREDVRLGIEQADAVLILGAFMTDINLGIYTAHLDEANTINANSERITIRYHHYDRVVLRDFIRGLTRALATGKNALKPARRAKVNKAAANQKVYKPQKNKPCTVRRFFERMNDYLDDGTIVIADIGDSLFGAADLTIHRRTEFISPAYYTSMGFAVPASIGAQMAAPDLRPIVFVGDGAFQMTGQELATAAKYSLNPIVFVLNNKGYTTERFINEGPYNDIHEWAYHLLPQIFRKGWGCEVRTEGELEEALTRAWTHTQSFCIINVHLDKLDRSKALERLATRMSKQAGLKSVKVKP